MNFNGSLTRPKITKSLGPDNNNNNNNKNNNNNEMLLGGERSLPEMREMHRRSTPEKYVGNIPFARLGINKIIIYEYYQHRHGL